MPKGQDKELTKKANKIEKWVLDLEKHYFSELKDIFQSNDFTDGLTEMENWINSNYQFLTKHYDKSNKVALPIQRLINFTVQKKLKNIKGVYYGAISSDIAFETDDAIINIDSKTVSQTGNKSDFNALFFGPNQSNFVHKKIYPGNIFPGFDLKFKLPIIDNITNKPILTFFFTSKYLDDKKTFSWYQKDKEVNTKFICLPNGEISKFFNYDIFWNAKDWDYCKEKDKHGKNIKKIRPEGYNFPDPKEVISTGLNKGYYLINKKEAWLFSPQSKPSGYYHAIKPLNCRVEYSTLKKRYDSNLKEWEGYSEWSFK